MKCERCGKNLGEYLCSVCNRVVCKECKVIKNGKVLCLDCAKPQKEENLKGIKKAIYSVLIILIGIAIIYYITNSYLSKIQLPKEVLGISFLMDFLKYFELLGLISIFCLSIILIILVIIFLIKRKKKK